MTEPISSAAFESSQAAANGWTHIAHAMLRLVSALRYHKSAGAAVAIVCFALGTLYYLTAPRRYASKAVLLVTARDRTRLEGSLANDEAMRRNTMPTFEKMACSAKVLEGALERLAPEDRIDFEGLSRNQWTGAMVKRNAISAHAVYGTNILELQYFSQDPEVAVHVVQAIIASYRDFIDAMHQGAIGQLSRILKLERTQLTDQLNRKQDELLAAQRRFADMGLRGDGKTLHPLVQRAVFFNNALIAAQKQRAELDALADAIETALRNRQDIGQYLVTVADVAGRELLLNSLGLGSRTATTQRTLRQSVFSDRAELGRLGQNLGDNHPEVRALAEKLRTTERYLQTSQERLNRRVVELRQNRLGAWLAQMVRQKLQQASQREQMLQAYSDRAKTEAISLNSRIAEIEGLERDVKRLSDMSDSLLNQIAAIDLKQSGSDVRVAVLEEPTVARSPASPRRCNVAVLTLAAAVGLSLAFIGVMDALDDRFRSLEEMQGRLGLPLLCTIPPMTTGDAPGVGSLAAFTSPAGDAAEGFRTLRTTLALTHADVHRIVVTSAQQGDGKTTILANFAVCCAQAGKKTLLIDADLRRPGLTALACLRGQRGLSDVLLGERPVDQLAALHIQRSPQNGLDILPSGVRPPNPAELLGDPRFSQLLAWAETVYDEVLVDSPPLLAATDAAIIGRLVDGVVLVVEPTANRRRLVVLVAERLARMKIAILGIAVNGINAADKYGQAYDGYHGYEDRSADGEQPRDSLLGQTNATAA
jgi:capsular exopolysaccharide synthesis family protein